MLPNTLELEILLLFSFVFCKEKLFDVKQVQLVKNINWYEISPILANQMGGTKTWRFTKKDTVLYLDFQLSQNGKLQTVNTFFSAMISINRKCYKDFKDVQIFKNWTMVKATMWDTLYKK